VNGRQTIPAPWSISAGSIWGTSPWNARVRIADVTRFSRMNGIDSEGHEYLIVAAPELRDLVATLCDWSRHVAAREDVPRDIRNAAATLHDDSMRLIAKTKGNIECFYPRSVA